MNSDYFENAAAGWDDQPHRVRLMRTIGETIVREARPAATMDVLDYGCGTGLVGLFLLPHVRSVTGADSSPAMLDVLRQKIADGRVRGMQAVRLDLETDAAPAGRFDMIVVSMAMHHIAAVDRVLAAFLTMLRPEGVLCLADLDSEPGTFHGADAAGSVHHNGFDRAAMKAKLTATGFAEPRDVTAATFNKPVATGGEQTFSIFLITARRP